MFDQYEFKKRFDEKVYSSDLINNNFSFNDEITEFCNGCHQIVRSLKPKKDFSDTLFKIKYEDEINLDWCVQDRSLDSIIDIFSRRFEGYVVNLSDQIRKYMIESSEETLFFSLGGVNYMEKTIEKVKVTDNLDKLIFKTRYCVIPETFDFDGDKFETSSSCRQYQKILTKSMWSKKVI